MELSELTNKELKNILRQNNVKNYSKLNKKDLVKKVNQLIKEQNGGKREKRNNGKKKYKLKDLIGGTKQTDVPYIQFNEQRKIELEQQKKLELEQQQKLEQQKKLELEKQQQLEQQKKLELEQQQQLEQQKKLELEQQQQLEQQKKLELEQQQTQEQQQEQPQLKSNNSNKSNNSALNQSIAKPQNSQQVGIESSAPPLTQNEAKKLSLQNQGGIQKNNLGNNEQCKACTIL
jgi:hypothetical protein